MVRFAFIHPAHHFFVEFSHRRAVRNNKEANCQQEKSHRSNLEAHRCRKRPSKFLTDSAADVTVGQPRIFFSMARRTTATSSRDAEKTPTAAAARCSVTVGRHHPLNDKQNIGTLFAFVLVCVGIIILRYKDPSRARPFRVPFGTWLIPTLGAVSCIFLMYYLPPASWWRFIGWLMLGMSVYLSYGYVRSAVGQKLGRPFPTPMGLKVAAVGFLLLAVGLFIIPHSSSMAELYEKMMSGMMKANGPFSRLPVSGSVRCSQSLDCFSDQVTATSSE